MNHILEKARGARLFVPGSEFAQIAVSCLGFFIGRAVIMKTLNPVAVGMLATLLGTGGSFYAAALFTAAGLFTKLKGFYLLRYVLCIGILCAANFVLRRWLEKRKNAYLKELSQGAAGAASLLAAGLFSAWLDSGNTYLALVTALESVLVFSAVFVLKKATGVLYGKFRKTRILRQDEMISLAVAVGALIAGASDIYVGGVSLRYFLCIFFTVTIAYKGGAAIGGVGGLLIGFMLYVCGYWDISMGVVFAGAGIGGGVPRKFGKLACLACALVMGTACVFYLERPLAGFEALYSAIFAGLLFFLIPQDFSFQAASYMHPSFDNSGAYMEKIKDTAVYKLTRFAEAFDRLASAFDGLAERKSGFTKNDIPALIDDIAAKACENCPKRRFCWDENFYFTYQNVFGILNGCDKNKKIEAADLGAEFRELCADAGGFADRAQRVYETYRANRNWNLRILESRELVGQQLSGVSGIIRRLAEEIDVSLKFHEELEEEIMRELAEQKIEADNVVVVEDGNGRYEVDISHRPYYEKKPWNKTIGDILARVLKKKMRLEDEAPVFSNAGSRGRYNSRFIEEKKLCVNSGTSRLSKSKDGVSGDTYSFMELKNGQCMLTLSDGMGTGREAKEESAATVELLEDFVESGFEKDLAVRIINSALVLKGTDESFSTLDVCCVDLYTGDAEFIKIGAASTFLRRDGKVSVIRSSSLPMGLMSDLDVEVSKEKLRHGDVVLMVTDGVLDADASKEDKEEWISKALRDCKYINPQDIADMVMLEAKRLSDGNVGDDMTVLAARFWENKY
ncbi:MAG: stage II sporulation protein E [Firmicutes bacterium]|nr:stage II sporulation protein E [Bacillota bacterium]